MIDAILHVLKQVGPASLSVWAWTVADYEINLLAGLKRTGDITGGLLVIDQGARQKNALLIAAWQDAFGATSVRYVVNHAKMATIETSTSRVLMRGSLNLNHNPRFENFDLTEGGADFALVRSIEESLPVLPDDTPSHRAYQASKVSSDKGELKMFEGIKKWRL